MAEEQQPPRIIRMPQPVTLRSAQAASAAPAAPEAPAAKAPAGPPKTADEARQRFFARYGLELIATLLGLPETPQPTTVAEWTRLAEATRDVLRAQAQARSWALGETDTNETDA